MSASIKVSMLSKEYPSVRAVKDLTFEVLQGTLHGFLGPNAAGKSTTINILAGITLPTSGEVVIEGYPLSHAQRDLAGVLGVLPEKTPLYLQMSPLDYWTFAGKIKGLKRRELSSSIAELTSRLALSEMIKRPIDQLSLGYRRKVAIGEAFLGSPKVVILDEPTIGLDPTAILEIREFLLSYRGEKTIFMSTHQLAEVEKICSHITVIHKGELYYSGKKEDAMARFSPQKRLQIEMELSDELRTNLLETFNLSLISKTDRLHTFLLNGSASHDIRPDVATFIASHGKFYSMKDEAHDLEDLFLTMRRGE